MTPRPDIRAIQGHATVGELRAMFREQEHLRLPVYQENPTTSSALSAYLLHIDAGVTDADPIIASAHPARDLRSRDQARAGAAQRVPAPPGADGDCR